MTPGLPSARWSATAGAADIVQVHEVAGIFVLATRASTRPGAHSAQRAKRRGILRGRELRRVATRALRAVASRRRRRVTGSYPQFGRRAERNRSVRAGPTAQARHVGQADAGEGRRRWAHEGGGSAACRPSRRGASPRIGWRPRAAPGGGPAILFHVEHGARVERRAAATASRDGPSGRCIFASRISHQVPKQTIRARHPSRADLPRSGSRSDRPKPARPSLRGAPLVRSRLLRSPRSRTSAASRRDRTAVPRGGRRRGGGRRNTRSRQPAMTGDVPADPHGVPRPSRTRARSARHAGWTERCVCRRSAAMSAYFREQDATRAAAPTRVTRPKLLCGRRSARGTPGARTPLRQVHTGRAYAGRPQPPPAPRTPLRRSPTGRAYAAPPKRSRLRGAGYAPRSSPSATPALPSHVPRGTFAPAFPSSAGPGAAT